MELTYAPEFDSPWIARTDGPEPFEAYGADPASALAALVRRLEDAAASAQLAAACPVQAHEARDPNRCDNPEPHAPHTWNRLRLVGQTRDHRSEETDCPGLTAAATTTDNEPLDEPFEYTHGGWYVVDCQTPGCLRGWLIPRRASSASIESWTQAQAQVNGRDGWNVVDGYARCPDHVPSDRKHVRHQITHSPDREPPPGNWWVVTCPAFECRRGWNIPKEGTPTWPRAAQSIDGADGWRYDGANAWCPDHQPLPNT